MDIGGWLWQDDEDYHFTFGTYVGRHTSERLAWGARFDAHAQVFQGDWIIAQFKLEAGPQLWLTRRTWIRPTAGVVFGGLDTLLEDDEFARLSAGARKHETFSFLAGSASMTVGHIVSPWKGMTIEDLQGNTAVGGLGVYLRYGKTFVPDLPIASDYLVFGIGLYI